MTLLIVVATSLAMQYAGLSMALGAFLAGVLLAESEYRHELEADIEPFKGLLLGLFFIAVGASVNLSLIPQQPLLIAGLVVGLVAVKIAVLLLLGLLAGLRKASALQMAILVSQGGEFAFVLFTAAVGANVIPRELSDQLILVVTLTMITTPVIILAYDLIAARFTRRDEPPFDKIDDEDPRVIIAGFGRFGQIIARILRAKKIRFTALDSSPQQIDFVRQFGNKVYYGDATRLDLLRAAGADKAKVFVLAVDNADDAIQIARVVRQNFPHLQVFARARNRRHVYQFMNQGVQTIVRETFFSSLHLAGKVLHGLGLSRAEAERAVLTFKEHDERVLADNYEAQDDLARLADVAKQAAEDLERLFEEDADKDRSTGT
jgi:glutathione-regulated potassium-efflux system ancillary protein KefC/glutathione-regulated potassium-efflux system protein KefB